MCVVAVSRGVCHSCSNHYKEHQLAVTYAMHDSILKPESYMIIMLKVTETSLKPGNPIPLLETSVLSSLNLNHCNF